jgi:hypothetical protein
MTPPPLLHTLLLRCWSVAGSVDCDICAVTIITRAAANTDSLVGDFSMTRALGSGFCYCPSHISIVVVYRLRCRRGIQHSSHKKQAAALLDAAAASAFRFTLGTKMAGWFDLLCLLSALDFACHCWCSCVLVSSCDESALN